MERCKITQMGHIYIVYVFAFEGATCGIGMPIHRYSWMKTYSLFHSDSFVSSSSALIPIAFYSNPLLSECRHVSSFIIISISMDGYGYTIYWICIDTWYSYAITLHRHRLIIYDDFIIQFSALKSLNKYLELNPSCRTVEKRSSAIALLPNGQQQWPMATTTRHNNITDSQLYCTY